MSISVKDLSFAYGKYTVLQDVSFELPDATLVSVLGANGAGKSTLFKCMLGLNPRYSGEIWVNEKNLKNLNIRQRAKEIAYIPQSHASIYDFNVLDVVIMSTGNDLSMFGTPKAEHVERAYKALERVGIAHLADRPYTQTSGGEQQLALIARAIAQNARTIIMDEPTSALDYGNTVRVLSTAKQLAREGLSIVQSTHQPDHAFLYSDLTLVLKDGGIYAYDKPKEIISNQLVSDIYGIDVAVESLFGDKVRVCVPIQEIR